MGTIYINPSLWGIDYISDQDQTEYIDYWNNLGWEIRISNEIRISLWQRISRRYPLYVTDEQSRKKHCVHVVYDNNLSSQARLSNLGILEFVISDFKELSQILNLYR